MAKPPPLCGIAGHERLGQEVQGGAVDDHPRRADGVDHRATGGIAQHVDLAALGAVEERLSHVAVDDQLALLADLAELVLGVAVDVDLQAVHAGAEIVARVVVAVDPQTRRCRDRSPTPWNRVPRRVVVDQTPPAEVVGLDRQRRIAVLAFGRETAGVDQQRRLAGPRAAQAVPGVPGDAYVGAGPLVVAQRLPLEDLLQAAAEDGQHGTAFLPPGGVAAVHAPASGLRCPVPALPRPSGRPSGRRTSGGSRSPSRAAV